MDFLDKLDKQKYTFIVIFCFVVFAILSSYVSINIRQNEEITNRLDNIEKNINDINYEISNIKDTASDTDAKIINIEDTLIDKIDTEIDNYMAEVEENTEAEIVENVSNNTSNNNYTANTSTNTYIQNDTEGVLTKQKGVNYYGDQKETYYNLTIDGVINNARAQGIEGEYWVREDGCKMYGDYIIVAANLDTYPRGSLVETSLGIGIVLDTGGFAASNPNQVDIATDW